MAAVPVLGAQSALAQPYPPQPPSLTLGADTVTQGDSLDLTGTGFGPGEDGIESAIFSDKVILDFHTADENGTVTDTVTIPHHVKPGEHIFRLEGEMQVLLAEITVLDDEDDPGRPGDGDGPGRPGDGDGDGPGRPGDGDGDGPGRPGDGHGHPGDGDGPDRDQDGRPGRDHDGRPRLADTGEDHSALLLGGVAGLFLLGGGAILLTRRVKRG
ncbi:LPXTG cell wall anchor domain-containing protein [Streptomyces sp. HNM0663]|uniref:LPXTG cell wall anchor domain-containing protein n=1 Tax=Streptomyces chengmaiensis TaxID=3040919 RepID=A0ABT6HGD8_9ACTN|nr:LPXTG cell wall anchor domain-containing protein [Streptomyces chengmaiensis]MDH2387743.1 LPXTG cell wall anchor domain-containing protein [Streptomyces chengmaiensis]